MNAFVHTPTTVLSLIAFCRRRRRHSTFGVANASCPNQNSASLISEGAGYNMYMYKVQYRQELANSCH